jgi:hypothetical protein
MKSMKKLSIAIAAMAISGALASPATAVSRESIAEIRRLVDANEGRRLGLFLAKNACDVFDGSVFGTMMMNWYEWTIIGGVVGYYSGGPWDEAITADMRVMMDAVKTDASLY